MAYTTIDDPSAYFQTTLYTGNGGTQSVTNGGNSDLQPDWVWIKSRNEANSHQLYDSVRGVTKRLISQVSNAEDTASNGLTHFLSDGFTVGSDSSSNLNNDPFVAWNWKAGGSASTNSQGATNSSVSVNTDAGFSIASATTSTSSGSTTTIGHGLGVSPDMIIWKPRNATGSWGVAHKSLGITSGYLSLNATGAFVTEAGHIDGISSTLITLGQYIPNDSNIFYSFAEKKGYSKFGSYTGNGNADGSFCFTGMKTSFVMIKRTDATNHWLLMDAARADVGGANPVDQWLRADGADAESSGLTFDFLSNGFKCRGNDPSNNASGGNYIYMAFAENPFVTSTGVPTTAR